jgi:hypothetical protein
MSDGLISEEASCLLYLERAILLLGLTLVVQVGTLLHHLTDLVRRHVLDLLVRHLDHVGQLLSAAEGSGRRVIKKCTE